MLTGTCLLLIECFLVWKNQNPVSLKICSYEAGVTLLVKMKHIITKIRQVKFKHEHDVTSHCRKNLGCSVLGLCDKVLAARVYRGGFCKKVLEAPREEEVDQE